MTDENDGPGLDVWLAQIYQPDAVPDDASNAPILRWLARYFAAEGATDREVVRAALVAHRLALANEAAAAALHDVEHATSIRPRVSVEAYDSDVRIVIDGGFTAPSMWALNRPAAFAEVADYFQEHLDRSAWPVCDAHKGGLHAEVRDGTAVWRCRIGAHNVAAIGAFSP